MRDDVRISLHETRDDELFSALAQGVRAFSEPFVDSTASRHLSVVACDAEGGLLGGVYGRTVHGHYLIEVLFVDEAQRGHGLGRELMARAEAEVRRRGCRGTQGPIFIASLASRWSARRPTFHPATPAVFSSSSTTSRATNSPARADGVSWLHGHAP